MVRGKLKRPEANRGKHVPAPEPAPDWDDYPPIFTFDHMAASHSIDTCDKEEKAALMDAIWKRSRMTWRTIRLAPRHGLGTEKIKRINHPLPAIVTADARLLAMRFSGMKAMIGIRADRFFHVIWLDSEFEVYDH